MKRRLGLALSWRAVLGAGSLGLIAVGVLMYRLNSLVPGLAPEERSLYALYASFQGLLYDPLNLPMKLLLIGERFLPRHDALVAAHLPSIILGVIAITAYAYILRRWYGRRSLLFGFALLLCSAWFLHIARFASFDIEAFTGILVLLAAHTNLNDHEESAPAWFGWLAANLFVLFIPGMLLLVLAGAALQWRAVWHAWQALGVVSRISSFVLLLLSLGWLAFSFARRLGLAFVWLGVPEPTMHTLRAVPMALLHTVMAIGYQGEHRPELWLGQLPALDLFVFVMLVAGIIFYARHWQAPRAVLLGSFLVLSLLLASVGGSSLDAIVPLLYLIAVGGIAYVLHFWLKVFPRNPIARTIGIGLVAVLVGLSCYYNLVQYFVAWPRNPETIAVYRTN